MYAYATFMSAPSASDGIVPELADVFWRPAFWESKKYAKVDPTMYHFRRGDTKFKNWQEVTWLYDLAVDGVHI